MEKRKIIQVEEKVPFKLLVPLSIQHMFAMFGASVLVPFVFGINPAIVFLTVDRWELFCLNDYKGVHRIQVQVLRSPGGVVIGKFVQAKRQEIWRELVVYWLYIGVYNLQSFGSNWMSIVILPPGGCRTELLL